MPSTRTPAEWDREDRHAIYSAASSLHYYSEGEIKTRNLCAWLALRDSTRYGVARYTILEQMAHEHDANARDAAADRADLLTDYDTRTAAPQA